MLAYFALQLKRCTITIQSRPWSQVLFYGALYFYSNGDRSSTQIFYLKSTVDLLAVMECNIYNSVVISVHHPGQWPHTSTFEAVVTFFCIIECLIVVSDTSFSIECCDVAQ